MPTDDKELRFDIEVSQPTAKKPRESQVTVLLNPDGSVQKEVKAPPIENIVFEGGGVRGLVYAGAIAALENEGIEAKRVAGSSAGALTALIVGLGFSTTRIDEIISGINMGELVEVPVNQYLKQAQAFRAHNFEYVNEGNKLLEMIQDVMRQRIQELIVQCSTSEEKLKKLAALNINLDRITFRDLRHLAETFPESKIKDITITGTKLLENGKGQLVLFNYENTPDMEVALAARISASIPKFFKAIKIDDKGLIDEVNGHAHVDGGCLYNFPMQIYESNKYAPEGVYLAQGVHGQNLCTLGFKVDTHAEMSEVLFDTKREKGFIENVTGVLESRITDRVTTVSTSAAESRSKDDIYWLYSERTCQLHDQDVGMVDFSMTDEVKATLKKKGYDKSSEWLQTYIDGGLESKVHKESTQQASFKKMCQQMPDKELQTFCDFLDRNQPPILFIKNTAGTLTPADTQTLGEYQEIAKNVLKMRKEQAEIFGLQPNLPSKEDVYTQTRLRVSTEIEKLKHTSMRASPSQIASAKFRAEYVERQLRSIEANLSVSNLSAEEMTQKMLRVALSAFKPSEEGYKNIIAVAKSFNLNEKDIARPQMRVLCQIEFELQQLKAEALKISDPKRQQVRLYELGQALGFVNKTKVDWARNDYTQRVSDKDAVSRLIVLTMNRVPRELEVLSIFTDVAKNNGITMDDLADMSGRLTKTRSLGSSSSSLFSVTDPARAVKTTATPPAATDQETFSPMKKK